jgi:FkbM family methyltransferase
MKTLKDIMNELGHEHIDVLKMDIEGSEYDVLENILNENISVLDYEKRGMILSQKRKTLKTYAN